MCQRGHDLGAILELFDCLGWRTDQGDGGALRCGKTVESQASGQPFAASLLLVIAYLCREVR